MPEKLERCVKAVKKKGNVNNPWAVCNAALYGKHKTKNNKTKPAGH